MRRRIIALRRRPCPPANTIPSFRDLRVTDGYVGTPRSLAHCSRSVINRVPFVTEESRWDDRSGYLQQFWQRAWRVAHSWRAAAARALPARAGRVPGQDLDRAQAAAPQPLRYRRQASPLGRWLWAAAARSR